MTNMRFNQGKKFFASIYNKDMDERTTNGIIMTGSAYVGLHTYFNASYGIMKFSHKIRNKYIKYNTSPQFIQTMYNSTTPIAQKTGLYDYGVHIID